MALKSDVEANGKMSLFQQRAGWLIFVLTHFRGMRPGAVVHPRARSRKLPPDKISATQRIVLLYFSPFQLLALFSF